MPRPGRAIAAPAQSSLDSPRDVAAVERAARAFVDTQRASGQPIVLAVSGGCDSMVLMHAVARELDRAGAVPRSAQPQILTFDHGTGPEASAAVALVTREAARFGFDVCAGRESLPASNEAEWRAARWRFFREAASGRIATAHTRDDHVETVVMRAMRDSGARGLAGLAANSTGVVRPFLEVSRASIRAYGNERDVPFVEDPSNTSRKYLRNRLRLDLLPAIYRVRPRFAAEMLELSERAAAWRAEVDALALEFVSEDADDGTIRVAREVLATYDSATLCVLWPAIAARASVTLDRRGTLRLTQFTTSGARGARIQLSGGVEVFRHRDSFVLRPSPPRRSLGTVALSGTVQFGEWRFEPVKEVDGGRALASAETPEEGPRVQRRDQWVADLPADKSLAIRTWRPGDRMRLREGGAARRVKRFMSDAHIPGPSRAGWPVVLADDEIVWIPGVRRTHAASERSGRPVVRYICERSFGGFSNR